MTSPDARSENGPLVAAGGVLIFEGSMGYEVHFDTHDGRFSLVDAEMEREWASLTVEEVHGLHDAMTAALSGRTVTDDAR